MKKRIIFLIYIIVHMIHIFIFSILSTVEILPSINQKQIFKIILKVILKN